MPRCLALVFLLPSIVLGCITAHAAAPARPNILWITAEDMSPTLGCYGDAYASSPHIDRLANQGIRYTHAFATAPVCSPARSCLITGCYAPALGTHEMRSAFPIPQYMRGFPAELREAGYYTTNNVKTDYNTANWQEIIEASWNESSDTAHWRKRPNAEQPFFSVFNLMTSHQSRTMVWPREQFVEEVQSQLAPEEIHSPEEAPVPPYYPDTPLIRRTIARFYDCVTVMDKQVGELLAQLEDDGLADDTIVFFYSDHGSGMPRHKRALLDSGMHVPLIVRFPEKYRHLAPAGAGEASDRLVSFVDFPATVLHLAGVEVPEYMQGIAFLGNKPGAPREAVYGHRDRVDEVLDCARSVREQRFLYIRNYMPHRGYNQPSAWPEQGEIRHEISRLTDRSAMTDPQWHFAGPTRPVEELYDCQQDPHNLVNLANSPEHQGALQRLRNRHQQHIREIKDLGFLSEIEAWKATEGTTLWEAARSGELALEPLYAAAEQVGRAKPAELVKNLHSPLPGVRVWGAIGLAAQASLSPQTQQQLVNSLEEDSAAVRIMAADALAQHGEVEPALPVLIEALEHENLTTVLYAARTIELLGEAAHAAVPAMREALARAHRVRSPDTPATVVEPGDQDMAMFIGFSANAFLSRVDQKPWISLFDGKTLEGWEARAEGEVKAVEGEIQILSKGKNLWLMHHREFHDFELLVEAKMPDDAYNSGIGFRCSGKGKPMGYQCEIDGDKSGMIYAIGSGWVWPKNAQEKEAFHKLANDAFRPGEWNEFRIRCEGNHIQIWVNGTQTADVHDDRFDRGSFALQHHGRGGVHRFKAIRLREL